MSVSDGTDSQCCETTTEPYGVAMGDVLAKGYYNDDEKLKTASEQSTDDSEDEDSRLSGERQAADGASDALDDVSSSINLSRLALTIVDDAPGNDSSDDTALRIEAQVANLTSAESTCTDTEHSLDCSYAVCPNDCSQHPDSFCPCDTCKLCKLKRAMIDDELKREIRWHRLWTELRDHIRSVFEAALEATVVPNTVQYQCDPCRLSQLRENVVQMCKRNSQQLLLMLIVQAQEFVVELKNRIKETLHDRSLTNVAEIFLTRILDGYDAFVSTAKQVSDLVKPVEERHLLKFNLTWEFFNKALYENHIWISEPSMRNVTGSFTTQLTKSRRRHSYQALFERYVAFVAEMMRVAELWPETERLIVKWNDKQTADRGRASDFSPVDSSNVSSSTDILPRSQDKCEGSNEEEIAERTLRTPDSVPHSLSNGTSVNASTETNGRDNFSSLSPITRAAKAIARKDFNVEDRKGLLKKRASTGSIANNPLHELDVALRHKTDIVQEIANDLSESMDREPERQMCQCIYEHMREIDETGRTWWSDSPCLCVLNLRWLCGVSKACPCLSTAPTAKTIPKERPESPTSTTPTTMTVKQTRHSTTQTANPMITDSISVEEGEEASTNGPLMSTATTTMTTTTPILPPTTTHNHNHNPPHQGTCSTHNHFHGASSDSTKSTGSSHRAHNHNNHALHIYRKHAKVEEIKRILCNDLSPGDGDCSDSGSSQEDSCSTSSSTPRDSSRHCDCCYCEVFGPGLPSVAPVSRNYNEMRERLRQLLTKKKAKKCKAPCSPPKSPAESSIASSTSTDPKATPPLRSAPSRSNTPIPLVSTTQPEQRDQRDLEALLEFIEGNQGTKKDNKKTEKKARQKQRKLDEILRKEKEEADKQKLIELQKKTPEVTITVVDPLKPISQRLPQRNLPEVSILPATVTPVSMLAPQKQANTSKKKEKQAQKQQQKQEKLADKYVDTNSGKSKNSTISVTPINMNVYDFVVRDSANDKTKRGAKSDSGKNVKATNSKNDKVQSAVPAPVVPPANDATDVKLTKKERKKMRREMKKLEEAKAKEPEVVTSLENKPQIVTIKRVMESNNAEPTVTITLKGQTPAEDKVLFTLVNGQTKEPGSAKTEQQQGQPTGGKKKKGKSNGGGNQNQNGNQSQQQQTGKVQSTTKQQMVQKGSDSKAGKQQQLQQQQANSEKSKGKKGSEEKKVLQESQQSNIETKSTKSKKEKKNAESKQIVAPATTAKSKNSQQQQQQQQTQQGSGKKQNKANATQQIPVTQKSQQNANTPSENSKKKSKGQQQQQNEQNAQANLSKSKKKPEAATNNKKQPVENESQKSRTKSNQTMIKQQRSSDESMKEAAERHNALLSTQLKDFGPTSKINIENLKLPPGITITKVDAPAKSLPIKSAPMPKPVTATKQTTIIAAPMSGVQSSYPGPQTAGNVIVVDTGKLKQDLLPKNNDKSKEIQKDSQAGSSAVSGKKKKKKKKGKNSLVVGSGASVGNGSGRGGNDSGKENGDESAKIVHNPGSNMITIRNPAFGPAPKIDTTPQAAIIKVSENGMVTIRSPALQQAINAGLTPPSQPDFIVKGDPSLSNNNSSITNNRATLTPTNSTNHRNTNGIVSPSLAEFRSRLTADCTSLPGLANIHISKVTNGQPIPERGINLRGTSVTLTKVRSPDVPVSTSLLNTKANNTTSIEEVQQAKTAVREAINATINVPAASSKGKKKKKRGNGTKHSGDDWNLVESVFTPKDIDLEDGEMDDAERELEAFKRFCLQSVPPPRKEKVNLNIKDIVLKKKSSSSSSSSSSSGGAAAPVIAAN